MGQERICVACRETRLSRYNSEPLCAACARAARDSKGIAPAWLWDSEPMREALARTDLAAVVAIFRSASGLSQMELGDLIEGWSQSFVSLTEQGRRDTLYDIRRLLAFADAVEMPRHALLPLVLGRTDVTLEDDGTVAFLGADPMDMDRRGFNTMATGLTAAAFLPPPTRVDKAHVRYLQAVVDRLRTRDQSLGDDGLLHESLRHYARARRMLDESDYGAAVGGELLVVTGALGLISGWLAFDADDQPLARRLYQDAELLANSADDAELSVHLYANMAQQSARMARITGRKGYAREALRFADRAAVAARHAPAPALHALVARSHALAQAHLGDRVAFRSAVASARRELDRGRHELDPPWTRFLTHSEITSCEGLECALQGAHARAADLYRTRLEDAQRSSRDQAYSRARLAATLVEVGDVREGVREGVAVLPESGERLRSVRTLKELRPVRDAGGSEEFRERYDAAIRALA